MQKVSLLARQAAALGQGLPACGMHSHTPSMHLTCFSIHWTRKACHVTGVGPVASQRHTPPGRAWFGVHILVPHSEESEVQSTRGLSRGLDRFCTRTCPIPSHTSCVPPEPPSILILELPLPVNVSRYGQSLKLALCVSISGHFPPPGRSSS